MAVAFWSCRLVLMFLCSCLHNTKADYFGDVRCICVCDKTWNPDGKKVVLKSPTPLEFCNCDHLVKPVYPTLPCSGCFCNVEMRNTATIKVVVFIILCVVSLLLVFMMFLTLVDPLIQRCLDMYLEHAHVGGDLTTGDRDSAESSSTSMEATSTAAKENLKYNTIETKQKKWEGTVQEQRRTIYDKHSMFN